MKRPPSLLLPSSGFAPFTSALSPHCRGLRCCRNHSDHRRPGRAGFSQHRSPVSGNLPLQGVSECSLRARHCTSPDSSRLTSLVPRPSRPAWDTGAPLSLCSRWSHNLAVPAPFLTRWYSSSPRTRCPCRASCGVPYVFLPE